jgi:beta-lactamase class D
MRRKVVVAIVGSAIVFAARLSGSAAPASGDCFILDEIGRGTVRRNPSTTCGQRITPQSTFKIPHALAALDAGVVTESEVVKYDGHPVDFPAWQRDHTLATALRFSVVWYFQEMARRLGPEREKKYLAQFEYGNGDASGGLTTFWLGSTLAISPDEQERFLVKLFTGRLQVGSRAAETVTRLLKQPDGRVVNATGEHDFGSPWPAGTVVSAKTGAGPTGDGRAVRWIVGHVSRGSRAWVFVSNVVGATDLPAMAAVDQASRALIDEHVLR